MDFLISGLGFLAKQKKLQPAEQILSEKLANFETTVPSNLEEKQIIQLEEALIGLMGINGGTLSMQFCHRLSECFVFLYNLPNAPKIFNLVTYVQKNPSQTSYFTIGFVVNEVGDKNKAMMNSLTESILKVKKQHTESALFALNYIIKVTFNEVKKYAKNFYSYVEANHHNPSIFVKLYSIKILRKLIKSKIHSPDRLLKSALLIYNESPTRFVQEKAACYVADVLLALLSKPDGMKEIVSELCFINNCTPILTKFCQFINNTVLNKNAASLLRLVKTKDKSYVQTFTSLLSIDTKKQLFERIEKEKESDDQLLLLRHLSYDTDTDRTVAAIASKLIVEGRDDITNILSFYEDLATKNIELSRELLMSSSIFLAYPPEQYQNLNQHLVAMSLVCGTLILNNKSLLTQEICDNLGKFQDTNFMSDKIFKGGFIGAFITARALKISSDEKIKQALNTVLLFLEHPTKTTNKLKLLISAVAGFLANEKTTKSFLPFLHTYLQLPIASSIPTALAYSCLIATKVQLIEFMFDKLMDFYMAVNFTHDFYESKLNVSTLAVDKILGRSGYKFVNSCSLHISHSAIEKYAFDTFPSVVTNAPDEQHDMSRLLHNEGREPDMPAKIGLLFALSKTNEGLRLLPADTASVLMRLMAKMENDIDVCVCSEVVSRFCKVHHQAFAAVRAAKQELPTRQKAILDAAIVFNCDVHENVLTEIHQELCDICKTEGSHYAFYGLSVLFQSCQFSSVSQSLAASSLHFLVNVFNSKLMMNPVVCYYASTCFNSLMPLVSSTDDSMNAIVIGEALQCLAGTKAPFCRAFYLRALSQALNFARKTVTKPRVKLASKRSFSIEVSGSCGAICDMQKDEFGYMNTALFHLQIYSTGRIQEYVVSCSQFSKKVKDWVNLIKDVITNSTVPGTTIEARNDTKRCVLRAMKPLINRIRAVGDTEALDDTITALIKVVTSSTSDNQMLQESFNRFAEIIDTFVNVIKLDVYDSQFAIALRSALNYIHISDRFLKVYFSYIMNSGQVAHYISDIVEGIIKAPNTNERTCFASYIVSTCINANSDLTLDSAKRIATSFEDSFIRAFNRASAPNSHWQTAAEFRADFSDYFGDILVALVFALATTKSQKVEYDTLCKFLIETSSKSTEKWRIDAAVRGIVATFEYLEKLDDSYRSDCLKNVPKKSEMSYLFERAFSRQLTKGDKLLNEFYDYVSTAVYDDEVYARIVKVAPKEFIEKNGRQIFDLFVKRPKFEHLCTLLFLVTKADIFEEKVLAVEENIKKVILCGRLVSSTQECSDKVAEFLAENFSDRVVTLCGRLFQRQHTIPAAKLILSKLKDDSQLPETEDFAILVLWLFTSLSADSYKFMGIAIKKLASMASTYDAQKSRPAEFALKLLKETDEGRHLLRVLTTEQMDALSAKFEKMNKAKENASRFTLKTFGNARKVRGGESNNGWVDLDGSDSDNGK